jgi:ABC-type nitrate/sulfonate/bicarbonate transport system permease component
MKKFFMLREIFDWISRHFPSVFVLVAILLVWSLVSSGNVINPVFLPRPYSVAISFFGLLSERPVYINIFQTVFRAISGLGLTILVAIPVGLFLGRYPRVYSFFELPIDFVRSIPSSALFFLFILLFGLGNAAKIAVVFYGCFFVLLINTMYGARPNREKTDRINMLLSFGAQAPQIFRYSILPDAMPGIIAGVRVCMSLALVLVVVTEMFLSANDGLGKQLYDFYLAFRIEELYATILILGLIGFAANRILQYGERRLTFWKSI